MCILAYVALLHLLSQCLHSEWNESHYHLYDFCLLEHMRPTNSDTPNMQHCIIIRSEISHICRIYNTLALYILHWVHILHTGCVTCLVPCYRPMGQDVCCFFLQTHPIMPIVYLFISCYIEIKESHKTIVY